LTSEFIIECKAGQFGENCTEECLSACANKVCNSTTGDCFACNTTNSAGGKCEGEFSSLLFLKKHQQPQ
jgi:hypothetical protein